MFSPPPQPSPLKGEGVKLLQSLSPPPRGGRSARSAGWGCFVIVGKLLSDGLKNAVKIFKNFVVPKPQDSIAFRLEPVGSLSIALCVLRVVVLTAVKLEDEFGVEAGEIDDVFADGHLPPKTKSIHLFAAQVMPEFSFRLGRIGSQIACTLVRHELSLLYKVEAPPPQPSPFKGEGESVLPALPPPRGGRSARSAGRGCFAFQCEATRKGVRQRARLPTSVRYDVRV